ncbi:MAG: DNA-3-methyladenine glycosylase [Candidatus Magasanikbacteria bacterium]
MNKKIIEKNFFRKPALEVAEKLVGNLLVRKFQNGNKKYFKIIETEAYTGPEDKACHASKKPTDRTEVMFGPPGFWYVYLVYGIHLMLNVITNPKGHPAGVLIRALKPIDQTNHFSFSDLNGPGKLTRELDIDKSLDGKKVSTENGVWFQKSAKEFTDNQIKKTPRIGVEYADQWANKPYRFVLDEINS